MAFKRVWALILGSNNRDEEDPWLDFHVPKWVKKKKKVKNQPNKKQPNQTKKISSLISSLEIINFLFLTSP